MKPQQTYYGDRVDRKARLAQRLIRNEVREKDFTKYNAYDILSYAHKATNGTPVHRNLKENKWLFH